MFSGYPENVDKKDAVHKQTLRILFVDRLSYR